MKSSRDFAVAVLAAVGDVVDERRLTFVALSRLTRLKLGLGIPPNRAFAWYVYDVRWWANKE